MFLITIATTAHESFRIFVCIKPRHSFHPRKGFKKLKIIVKHFISSDDLVAYKKTSLAQKQTNKKVKKVHWVSEGNFGFCSMTSTNL